MGINLCDIQCVHLFLYFQIDFCCICSASPFHTVLIESASSFIYSLTGQTFIQWITCNCQALFLGHKGRHLTSPTCKFIIWYPTEIGEDRYNKTKTVLCDRSEHRILWEQKTISHLEFAKYRLNALFLHDPKDNSKLRLGFFNFEIKFQRRVWELWEKKWITFAEGGKQTK